MKIVFAQWKTGFQQRRAALSTLWQTRTERERQFLLVGGIALTATLFYLMALAPALEGRAQLQRSLPQLRLQAAQLRALADEAAALPAPAESPAMPSRQKVESALRQHGLKAQNIAVSGDGVRLQFDDVPFASLIDFLTTLQKTQQLAVADASFAAKDKPGIVGATLQLARSGAAGP